MAALHAPLTLRAVTHFDVEAAHDRTHLRDFFLILRCHASHFDRPAAVGTRRRHRRLQGLVNPFSAAGGTPAGRSPHRPAGRDAGRVLGVGSSRRGRLVGTPPGAQRPTAASGARSPASDARPGVASRRSVASDDCCRVAGPGRRARAVSALHEAVRFRPAGRPRFSCELRSAAFTGRPPSRPSLRRRRRAGAESFPAGRRPRSASAA